MDAHNVKKPVKNDDDEWLESNILGIGSFSLYQDKKRNVKDKKIVGFVRPKEKKVRVKK